MSHAWHRFGNVQDLHVLLTFGKVQKPLRLPRKTASEPSKVVRAFSVLKILTWKCASGHNGVHFFDRSTSKAVRHWGVVYILTSKCASRHNDVHFFDISIPTKRAGTWKNCRASENSRVLQQKHEGCLKGIPPSTYLRIIKVLFRHPLSSTKKIFQELNEIFHLPDISSSFAPAQSYPLESTRSHLSFLTSL